MASEILESREQKTEEKELRQAVGDEGSEEYDWCIGCNLYVCIDVLPKSQDCPGHQLSAGFHVYLYIYILLAQQTLIRVL